MSEELDCAGGREAGADVVLERRQVLALWPDSPHTPHTRPLLFLVRVDFRRDPSEGQVLVLCPF